MKESQNQQQLKSPQQWGLIILRIIIGWHFLYEGIVKLLDPGWSAESYLANTNGLFSGIFHVMASDPATMSVVNLLNIWGLILIGLALFLGIFARPAVWSGILLLFFYYIAYLPFHGKNFGAIQEGHYLFVDKTFIELVTLSVLALFPGTLNIGLWNLLKLAVSRIRKTRIHIIGEPQTVPTDTGAVKSRREMVKNLAFIPLLGAFGWAFSGNKKYSGADAFSGSTFTLDQKSLSEIEGQMPLGVLFKGKPPISRLILGQNILSGTAHARDLIYARSLFRAYNNEKKIIETYLLAEKAGINLFYMSPILQTYMKIYGKNIQTWANVVPEKNDIYSEVDKLIDQGIDYILIRGATVDNRINEGAIDVIAKCIDHIKRQGYPAGLGAHTVQALIACEEFGIDPDFYYKTMHHDRYWSAIPVANRRYPFVSGTFSEDHNEFHDNMWCLFPEKTIEYISKLKKPVVGFKVLAGGAIKPEDGFQWAFDNGADFIEVGMFDFQIVDDVNMAIRCFERAAGRNRPWFG